MEEIRCRSSAISKHWSALNAFHQRRRHSLVTYTSAQISIYTRIRKHTNASKSNFAYYNFRDVSCITSCVHMCAIHTHQPILVFVRPCVLLQVPTTYAEAGMDVCVCRLQGSLEDFSFTLASFPFIFVPPNLLRNLRHTA